MNLKRLATGFAVIVVMQSAPASFGQQQNGTSQTVTRPEQTATTPINIYQVLDEVRRVADAARDLEPRAEIEIQTRLADSVWPLDPTLAERLLSRSFELTIAVLQEVAAAPHSASTVENPQMLFAQISAIAIKHDAKLDRKLQQRWQEALASVADKTEKIKPEPTQLSYLLLRQAATYLHSDEERARKLFRQSITIRVLPEHCYFLMSQRKRGATIADNLFSDTLDVLAQRPISEANELLLLSSYLFSPDGSIGYVVISGYNAANAAGNSSSIPTNPALAGRYLALLFSKINPNNAVPPSVAYFALKNLVHQYQALAPDLLNDVYAKLANLATSVAKDDAAMFERAHKDFTSSESEATNEWETRLQNANKILNEDRRDLEYLTILLGYVLTKNDFTRAEMIVNHISNQEMKQRLLDFVRLRSLQTVLEKPEVVSAALEVDCNKIKDPLLRVIALSSVGQAFVKQTATGDALRLFAQATAEAKQIKDEQDRLQAKLMLVQLYLGVDPSSGFESAAAAFREINKFSEFQMRRSTFSPKITVYGLTSELPIKSPFASSLVSAVAKMCRVNCTQTLQTCGLLGKKELRLWATLEAIRTALLDSTKEAKSNLSYTHPEF